MIDLGKYDYSQVVTEADLKAIARELSWQYHTVPWYHPLLKWATAISLGVVLGLVGWIQTGKGAIKNSGGFK